MKLTITKIHTSNIIQMLGRRLLYGSLWFSYSEASFEVNFHCMDGIDTFDEGVEFAARRCSSPQEWIPLQFLHTNTHTHDNAPHDIGEPNTTVLIRGYEVETLKMKDKTVVRVNISNIDPSDSIQFRWMQTSTFKSNAIRDVWTLDNVTINFISGGNSMGLLHDGFDNGSVK